MSTDLAPTAAQIQAATDRMAELETKITKGLKSFIEVGNALAEIQRDQLYKVRGFKTFADYVEKTWDRKRQWAYRLISARSVAENVSPGIQNERLARELARLPDAWQSLAWETAIETYGEQVTTSQLRALVDDYLSGEMTGDTLTEETDGSLFDTFALDDDGGGAAAAGTRPEQSERTDHEAGSAVAGAGRSEPTMGSTNRGGDGSVGGPEPGTRRGDGRILHQGSGSEPGTSTARGGRSSEPKARPPEEVVDVEPTSETPREPQKPRPKKKPRTDPHAIAVEELAFIKQAGDQYLKELLSKGLISSKDILSVDGSELTLDEYRVRRCAAFARVFHTLRATERVADAPPTLEEFLQMAREMELPTDRAEEFYFYQASTGWLNGTKWMIDIIAGYRHFLSRPWVKNPPKTNGKSGWGSDIPFEELA